MAENSILNSGLLLLRHGYDFQGPFTEFSIQKVVDMMNDVNRYAYPASQPTDPYGTAVDPEPVGSWHQTVPEFELEAMDRLNTAFQGLPSVEELTSALHLNTLTCYAMQ
ncbi:hypothetical protein RvY_12027 [Ramazzottius varieornatus]|uniref:Uncharacterized protein n=1 Tax=Ramazzottius varieornatus TaxID=947166 RepID=A0A1D1VI52_RAMVA|nr:hypothetical protein RvY_12027 [Ramazzottius varieornatus]